MISRLNVTEKGLILVLVPVLFEFVFLIVLGWLLLAAAHDIARLDGANEALQKLHETVLRVGESGLSFTDQTESLTRPQRLARVDNALALLPSYSHWGLSAQQHPELAQLIADSDAVRDRLISLLQKSRNDLRKPASEPLMAADPVNVMDLVMTVRSITNQIVATESEAHSAEPAELDRIRFGIGAFLILGVLGNCLISLALARFFTTDLIRRLAMISGNAALLSAGQPLPPVQQGGDEIVALDLVLHQTSDLLREARLREFAILDNASEIICSVDSRLRFLAANPATAKLWSYKPGELLGMSVLHLVAEETVGSTRLTFKRAAETGEESEFEKIIRCSGGELRHSRWKVKWSHDDGAFYCVIHDVTELRAIEKLKQEFLAMVSHDLRSPLSSVGISLAILLDGKRGLISNRARKLLSNAQDSAQKLTGLVNELLELEKLESSALVLDLGPVSASDACASARELLQTLAEQARVQIRGPVGDALILADSRRLVQVLINLLSNAIKFSAPESVVVISLTHPDAERVDIRITDEGPGIPAEHQALIFDKFQQSRAVSNLSLKSTGLGLAIVKAIVEAHHGSVGVESDGSHGSTFWIRLQEYPEDDL